MNTILKVHNIKCHGCEASIKDKLEKLVGIDQVSVDNTTGEVRIESTDDSSIAEVKATLSKMGYPEEDPTLVQTAKSYVNCMIGRTK